MITFLALLVAYLLSALVVSALTAAENAKESALFFAQDLLWPIAVVLVELGVLDVTGAEDIEAGAGLDATQNQK